MGAAVGSSPGYEKRVEALVKAGVDVIVVDSAHGFSKFVVDALTNIKKHHKVDVIAGNIATAEGAEALIQAGADGLRVGMGPGAICTTRLVSGMGVPQLTAILETAAVAKEHGVPVIADGGINYFGDITKALAAGASSVMMGRLFAATEESPGEMVELTRDQVPARFQSIVGKEDTYKFKGYRGMGSIGAMERGKQISSEDEFHGKSYDDKSMLVAEGVEGLVPCSGTLEETAGAMMEGLRSGFYYVGATSIPELWERAVLSPITTASLQRKPPARPVRDRRRQQLPKLQMIRKRLDGDKQAHTYIHGIPGRAVPADLVGPDHRGNLAGHAGITRRTIPPPNPKTQRNETSKLYAY